MSYFQMPGLNELIARLQQVSEPYKSTNGLTVKALCPCHNDHAPSLHVTEKANGMPLLFCQACGVNGVEVAEAVGLHWTEVVGGPGKKHFKANRTGHAQAALANSAASVCYKTFLMLTDEKYQPVHPELRLAIVTASVRLERLAGELRRADK